MTLLVTALAVLSVASVSTGARGCDSLKPWQGALDDGPAIDVAAINSRVRAHFGYLAKQYFAEFTIAEGDWALNASNLGEGFAYRIYHRRASSWQSPVFVSPEPCSIHNAGVPSDIAAQFAKKVHERIDLSSHDFIACSKPEPDNQPDEPPVAPGKSP